MKHYAPLDGRIVATSNAINAVVAGKMPFSTLGLPIE
jgi:hypothetical protein